MNFQLHRAAFDNVSKLTLRPHGRESLIDIRFTRLPSELSQTNEYEPRQHRDPKSPISIAMAFFNLARIGFGAGVLGIPLAISQAGIVLGPVLALSTGLLIIHTHLLLLWSLNEVCRHLRIPHISYRYGFRLAVLHGPPCFRCIARKGPVIIATFMILSQLGICTVFVTFTSDSLRDLMDWQDSTPALLSLLIPYLLLEFLMKNLKVVSYVSLFGNMMNIVGLNIVLYHIFKEPHGEIIYVAQHPLPVMFAFGTFLFNLSAVGVILSLDRAVVDPTAMTKPCGIVKLGILLPTCIATTFGVLGYWSFGTMEENVLRSLPFDDNTSLVAIGLYMAAIAFAYPIQCYPAIQIILEVIRNHNTHSPPSEKTIKILQTLARPSFVLLSFLVCYLVPFQGPFVAFVGSVCTTMLALVFPAMMEIGLMYPGPYGKYRVFLIKDIAIIVLGISSFICGAVLCGYLIYIRILSMYSPNNGDFI